MKQTSDLQQLKLLLLCWPAACPLLVTVITTPGRGWQGLQRCCETDRWCSGFLGFCHAEITPRESAAFFITPLIQGRVNEPACFQRRPD